MKKGYFFLIDGIFAIVILVIGFLLVSTEKPYKEQTMPVEFSADNFIDILSTVKLSDICENSVCTNKKIEQYLGQTNNHEQTIIDFLGELYSAGKKNEAKIIFTNLTYIVRNDIYGVSLSINNEELYSDTGKSQSRELIASKKMVFGFAENQASGKVRYWGPYLAEVMIWEK